MNNTIKTIVAGVVVLVVGLILGSLGGFKATYTTSVVQDSAVNSKVGGVVYDKATFIGDVYQGLQNILVFTNGKLYGPTVTGAYATTSVGAGTLTATNISKVGTILSTNTGALTLTLPASTTLTTVGFVPTAGDYHTYVVVNQGTGLLTFAGGTGTLLQTASSTKSINAGGTAELTCTRKTNTDIVCLLQAGI